MKEIERKQSLSPFDKKIEKKGLFDALTTVSSNLILLLDTSGSMARTTEGKSLLNHLKTAVEKYVGEYQMVRFDSRARIIENLDDMRIGSITDLISGLRVCKDLGASHVMLVSDGLPDNPVGSIKYCMDNKIKVSNMFIGNDDKGLAFMKQISESTGGNHTGNVDIKTVGFEQKMISGIRGLIECSEKKEEDNV